MRIVYIAVSENNIITIIYLKECYTDEKNMLCGTVEIEKIGG